MSPIRTRARARRENTIPGSPFSISATRPNSRKSTSTKPAKRRETLGGLEHGGRSRTVLADRTSRVNAARNTGATVTLKLKARRTTSFYPELRIWPVDDSVSCAKPPPKQAVPPRPVLSVRWSDEDQCFEYPPDVQEDEDQSAGEPAFTSNLSSARDDSLASADDDEKVGRARRAYVGRPPPFLKKHTRSRSVDAGANAPSDERLSDLLAGTMGESLMADSASSDGTDTPIVKIEDASDLRQATPRSALLPTRYQLPTPHPRRFSRESHGGLQRNPGAALASESTDARSAALDDTENLKPPRPAPVTRAAAQRRPGPRGPGFVLNPVDRYLVVLMAVYVVAVLPLFARMYAISVW